MERYRHALLVEDNAGQYYILVTDDTSSFQGWLTYWYDERDDGRAIPDLLAHLRGEVAPWEGRVSAEDAKAAYDHDETRVLASVECHVVAGYSEEPVATVNIGRLDEFSARYIFGESAAKPLPW